MLIVEAEFNGNPELAYVVDLVLGEWLDVRYEKRHKFGTGAVAMSAGGKALVVACEWLKGRDGPATSGGLPKLPLAKFDAGVISGNLALIDPSVPVIFGAPSFRREGDRIELGVDIFGSTFFMLARVEEMLVDERDTFDRFPGSASIACREGFLERPIIDEYVEILWGCLSALWPDMRRKEQAFRLELSCDVDHPYSVSRVSAKGLVRRAGAAMLQDRSIGTAFGHVVNYLQGRTGSANFQFDHCTTSVDWMMDVVEDAGRAPLTFYFKAGRSNALRDRDYTLTEPVVADMLQRIHRRGHCIGLHPSFETYKDVKLVCEEADRLREALHGLGIEQEGGIGGRQHYLRWATPITARAYEAAGLAFDSTLSFADLPGFRCGTTRPYAFFDAEERRVLNLVERPLVVMEASIQHYMKAGRHSEEAFEHMMRLKEACRRVNGTFSLLWHNQNIVTPANRRHYSDLAA